MTELNVHSKYIDKRINAITKNNKWNSKFIDTSHDCHRNEKRCKS